MAPQYILDLPHRQPSHLAPGQIETRHDRRLQIVPRTSHEGGRMFMESVAGSPRRKRQDLGHAARPWERHPRQQAGGWCGRAMKVLSPLLSCPWLSDSERASPSFSYSEIRWSSGVIL
ncbi:hypothetical protein D0Z66_20610 (plasmid) [Cereibacter sphaeroides]|nr:hypothetical protein D0Z66_20610 [Cereibacter sphaeroides]